MTKDTKLFLRLGLALWFVQTLVLASSAALLMSSYGDWTVHLEKLRLVRNFMANPLEMVIVKAFAGFCILVNIAGLSDSGDSFFDKAWRAYLPLFIGTCFALLFIRGLFRLWWLFG